MFAARRGVRPSTCLPVRQVHSTIVTHYPRGGGRGRRDDDESLPYDIDFMPEFEDDDATSAAHLIILQQRQLLNYLRLIERDAPRLQGLPSFLLTR